MMRTAVYCLVLTAFVCLCGCSESRNARLLETADAVMESDSQAAADSLALVDVADLSDADAALYALLYTQAQIKNWVVVDNDSLIGRAYDWYRHRNDGDRTIRAYFYKAHVAYNGGQLRKAVKDALTAYEMAKEERNPFWIAKSAELLSDIFFDTYNFPQAEFYSLQAIHNYKNSGKIASQRYAIADYAYALLNSDKYERVSVMLDSLLTECRKDNPVDTNLMEYIKSPYISACLYLNRLDRIDSADVRSILEYDNDYYGSQIKSMIYQQQNDYEKAEQTLEDFLTTTGNEEERLHLLYRLYVNAKKADEFEKAVSYTDSLILLQSSVARQLIINSVDEQRGYFYKEKSEKAEFQRRNTAKILYLSIACFVLTVLLLVTVYSHIVRNKRNKIERTLNALMFEREQTRRIIGINSKVEENLRKETEKVSALREALDQKETGFEQQSQVIESLFRNQWSTLNMLCNEYYEKGESQSTRKIILKNIEEEIERLRSPKNLKEIEKSVNRYMNNIMEKLREECRFLTSDEIDFLLLSYAGFSIRAICLFTGIKYKTFHNKKTRITTKIQEADVPDKNLFLKYLI